MSGDRTQLESGAADRLMFFSDAVVAIAMTLLALELPVPTGETADELWASVRHNADHYLAFLISFVVIASAWSQHHHVMRYMERSDARLRTLNMTWLLAIVLNPFATRLLTSEGQDTLDGHGLRYAFYALLQVFANATFLAMVHHMISAHLQAPDTPPRLIADTNWSCVGVILGFGISIPLFFVFRYAWVLWIVGPLLAGQIARRPARGTSEAA